MGGCCPSDHVDRGVDGVLRAVRNAQRRPVFRAQLSPVEVLDFLAGTEVLDFSHGTDHET